jgi:hypothetical protein
MKIAARIGLALALVVGVLAISDFAYNAYKIADCYTDEGTDQWGHSTPPKPKTGECYAEILLRDEHLRLDATAAVVAVALLIGSTVMFRKTRRHRR